MTLHPWPSNAGPSGQRPVFWKNGSALGLLTDTLAVPLRFEADGTDESAPARSPTPTPTIAAAGLTTRCDPSLLQVRELEARIGCCATT